MDDIYLPEEEPEDSTPFEKRPLEEEEKPFHPSGLSPSAYVKITFDRFVTLVANHSFVEVVERNKDEEIILSTNLLTDLANAKRFSPSSKGPLMVMGGLAIGILFGYLIFNGAL